MNLRLLLSRLLLSCVLLGAQQMGWTHGLSHLRANAASAAGKAAAGATAAKVAIALAVAAGDAASQATANPTGTLQADKACEQCLAFAQIDALLTACGIGSLPDRAPARLLLPPPQPGLLPATVCVFHSRAPPHLS